MKSKGLRLWPPGKLLGSVLLDNGRRALCLKLSYRCNRIAIFPSS